jgi:hypothetical protein
VRAFNAKRTRLLKQVPELEAFLPPKMSVADIKKSIQTRQDFNREINSLKRFLKKGAEKTVVNKHGVKTTKYALNELRLKVNRINRERAKKLTEMEPNTEKGTMGSIQQNSLRPKKFNFETQSTRSWEKFVESVDKQARPGYWEERLNSYKENFLKGLENEFSYSPQYETIKEKIQAMSPEELDRVYYQEPNLQLDYVYDEADLEIKATLMLEALQAYERGEI